VNKGQYFHGKYADTPNYCPLAWIKRVSSSADDLQTDLRESLKSIGCDEQTKFYDDVVGSFDKTSRDIVGATSSTLENVGSLSSNPYNQGACLKSEFATEARLKEAYAVCKRLQSNPEDVEEKFQHEFGDDELTVAKKITLLKQACNATFCNTTGDYDRIKVRLPKGTAGTEVEPPICFGSVDIKPIDMQSTSEDADDAGEDKSNAAKDAEKGMESQITSSVATVGLISVIVVAIVLFWAVGKNYMYPLLVKLWASVWDLFASWWFVLSVVLQNIWKKLYIF
jgi:hypothetical protein